MADQPEVCAVCKQQAPGYWRLTMVRDADVGDGTEPPIRIPVCDDCANANPDLPQRLIDMLEEDRKNDG